MSDFSIAETKTFAKARAKLPSRLYEKIRDIIYPELRRNPFFGPNIRKLRGHLEPYYRYRVGNYRLFYLIEEEKVLVVVVDLRHRQGAYY